LVNNDGKQPIDLIDDYVDNERIRKELKKMLDEQPTYYPCFHIK